MIALSQVTEVNTAGSVGVGILVVDAVHVEEGQSTWVLALHCAQMQSSYWSIYKVFDFEGHHGSVVGNVTSGVGNQVRSFFKSWIHNNFFDVKAC